jgi:DNA-binding transcriptional MerR regulator
VAEHPVPAKIGICSLVTTSELARALGLHMRTIQRYRSEGLIHPEVETKGGHARWDIESVKAELRAMRRRGDDDS